MRSLRRFEYLNPKSIEETASILREYEGRAWPIAGGTDLLTVLRFQPLPDEMYPEILVNLKNISPSLEYLKEEDGILKIGALTRLADIAKSELVKEGYPALAEACGKVGSPHIREMGTIGGNICQITRCWYFRKEDNRFHCLRKGTGMVWAMVGDNRYHSIFGSVKIKGSEPCINGCPNGIDIPSYIKMIKVGEFFGAAKRLLDFNPLSSITGRVCPHPCEEKCNRRILDESIGIRSIERFLGDFILKNAEKIFELPLTEKKERVAIVGSGPSGLTAAYYLRRKGYRITIFEAEEKAGGVLTYGIPSFRLPKTKVEETIEIFKRHLQIEFRQKIRIGFDLKVEELMEQFDAVLLATGCSKEKSLGIPGEEFITRGVDFLKKVNEGLKELPGKRVVVIGSGNVGIDVARVLLRMGAEPMIVEKEQLPETEEIRRAKEEGIRVEFLTEPIMIKKDRDLLVRCRKRKVDPLTGLSMPIEDSEFEINCDAVLKAIGESPDFSIIPEDCKDRLGNIKFDPVSLNIKGNLFGCGDFLSGPKTVVEAIASGRKVAESIDRYLSKKEEKKISEREFLFEKVDLDSLQKKSKIRPFEIALSERLKNLEEEDIKGLEEKEVREESARCFNCGCVMAHPSDVAPVLVALDAKIVTNKRILPIEEFFKPHSLNTTCLEKDEIVIEIQIPRPKKTSRNAFMKFSLRSSIDFPIVNCAASIDMEEGIVQDVKICLNAVYPIPFRAKEVEDLLKGKIINEEILERASEKVFEIANPLPYNTYKVQIAKALIKRTVSACVSKQL